MGFSLFGRSGDNQSTQTTTNVTNDTTVNNTDSNNVSSTLNAALTKNESYIRNETNVQNTALQLTDSFNRFNNYNLANVGNTNIQSPSTPSAMDYAAFFGAAPQATMQQTDLSKLKPLLDFNYLSDLSSRNLAEINGIQKTTQAGFANNVAATGTSAAGLNPAQTQSKTILYIVIAAAVVVIAFLFSRK